MGQFLQTNGDYNIKTAEGAKITLDTGSPSSGGQVVVTGNLLVEGTSVYVAATNLDIEDKIIVLNKGEVGPGVTLDYSGIQIDRGFTGGESGGTTLQASLLWNESIVPPITGEITTIPGGWEFTSGSDGTYSFQNSRIKIKEIVTDPLTDGGDLTLIGRGTGVVKITGTTDYTNEVLTREDANVIANKGYVDFAIENNPTFQIVANVPNPYSYPNTTSRVIISDADVAGSGGGTTDYLFAQTGVSTENDESAISIIADGDLSAQFYADRLNLFDLKVSGTEITTRFGISNTNIKLTGQGTGRIELNTSLQIRYVNTRPGPVSNFTMLFADDIEVGDTGLWFKNTNPNTDLNEGELISKRKALLFSMIF